MITFDIAKIDLNNHANRLMLADWLEERERTWEARLLRVLALPVSFCQGSQTIEIQDPAALPSGRRLHRVEVWTGRGGNHQKRFRLLEAPSGASGYDLRHKGVVLLWESRQHFDDRRRTAKSAYGRCVEEAIKAQYEELLRQWEACTADPLAETV